MSLIRERNPFFRGDEREDDALDALRANARYWQARAGQPLAEPFLRCPDPVEYTEIKGLGFTVLPEAVSIQFYGPVPHLFCSDHIGVPRLTP